MMQYRVLVIFLALFVCLTLGASNAGEQPPPSRNKLVVLMLGGCRWDYFSRDEESHSGFKTIKDEGVVAEYGQPIFPSVGYPSWTTIATGKIHMSNHNFSF
jgi:predicted AlkP superfamily pyrophosphatase or phosphodiesterase